MLNDTAGVLGTGIVAFLVMAGPPALAQDGDLMARGQQIFSDNCAACHQSDGQGVPPQFPALAGNQNLEDVTLIVEAVHQGRGIMPPFDHFSGDELAAVATFIRNSWGNSFGDVTLETVSEIAVGLGAEGSEAAAAADTEVSVEQASIWDGVYTEEQAARGEQVYLVCARCHGRRLNGAPDDPDMKSTPPLARAAFLRNWSGQSVAGLFQYTRATMPQNNPASMSDQEYADIIAYMLAVTGTPVGENELSSDPAKLGGIKIEPKPE
jgi:mono/diheme cytochrome c family protein